MDSFNYGDDLFWNNDEPFNEIASKSFTEDDAVPESPNNSITPIKRLSLSQPIVMPRSPIQTVNSHKIPERIAFSQLPREKIGLPSPKKGKPSGPITVQDEFYGVYCLISRSQIRNYKNRCYIGYTVDPNRRIMQHNGGRQIGGAKKTENRGPWDMVCVVHGFPNSVSALRFEWAWQNPDRSRRLHELGLKKLPKESPFSFRFRVVCQMLNSDPWKRLALTFRWLKPKEELPFTGDNRLPTHMEKQYGELVKTKTLVPQEILEYTFLKDCFLCEKPITETSQILRCPLYISCDSSYHVKCLAENFLRNSNIENCLIPIDGNCPKCHRYMKYGDLIRENRILLAIDDAKPAHDGMKIAEKMIPIKITKL